MRENQGEIGLRYEIRYWTMLISGGVPVRSAEEEIVKSIGAFVNITRLSSMSLKRSKHVSNEFEVILIYIEKISDAKKNNCRILLESSKLKNIVS